MTFLQFSHHITQANSLLRLMIRKKLLRHETLRNQFSESESYISMYLYPLRVTNVYHVYEKNVHRITYI